MKKLFLVLLCMGTAQCFNISASSNTTSPLAAKKATSIVIQHKKSDHWAKFCIDMLILFNLIRLGDSAAREALMGTTDSPMREVVIIVGTFGAWLLNHYIWNTIIDGNKQVTITVDNETVNTDIETLENALAEYKKVHH